MSEFNNPATKTATSTLDISYAELTGANRGQRPDLIAKEQGIFRTPDGKLYSSQQGQLLVADNLVPTFKTDPLTGRVGLILPSGATQNIQSVIARKTGITDGLVQVADQVFGSLAIPAGILGAVDTIFRIQIAYGRDVNTDAYGPTTNFRMGTTGTVADSAASTQNGSSLFPPASGGVSVGLENWFRVVSVGANSVVEKLGIANMGPSFNQTATSGAAVGVQSTLTGYNLLTQAGFFTITTTMAAATASKPRSGYMSLELMP